MSGLLLLCSEVTLFCTVLPENCIYLNQSELSNFFMYIMIQFTIFSRALILQIVEKNDIWAFYSVLAP